MESEKVGLKLNTQKTKIMASGNSVRLYFFVRAPKSLQMVTAAMKRNSFESVLMRRMNLEPITQSEVSQKEKDIYHILMHIYGI